MASVRPTVAVPNVGTLPRVAAAGNALAGRWSRIARSSACSSGPGSSPRSSASSRLTRRPAARASPCRPLRHSAVISATHRPSRCGASAISASSSPTTPPAGSSSARAASWASSRPSRSSSSRLRWGVTQSPSPAPASRSPRNSASASVAAAETPATSPSRRASATVAGQPGGAGDVDVVGIDVEEVAAAARPPTACGSPSARRSCDTFDCSVLRAVATAAPAHRSSIRRSVETRVRASSASRTSSSVVRPAGTGRSTPSRRTSTGPRTATASTAGA